LRILMIGDVIGKPGRETVRALLPDLTRERSIDFVICNGENTAGGFGITADTASELLESGVDVLTSGNHIWDKKEIVPYMDEGLPLIRSANYPDAPGRGYLHQGGVTVVNLMGRVFMGPLDCPFRTADALLQKFKEEDQSKVIIVDFHAEATSEKQAMGWYLDGRGQRSVRDPHPRRDRGRSHPAQGHSLSDRCWHDRAYGLCDWLGQGRGAGAVLILHAQPASGSNWSLCVERGSG